MALAISALTSNNANPAGTAITTASINPSAGGFLVLFVGMGLAGQDAVAIEVTGCAATWTQRERVNGTAACFIGTGVYTNQAVTINFAGSPSIGRAAWCVVHVAGTGVAVVQSAKVGLTANGATDFGPTLGAFGNVANWTLAAALAVDGSGVDFGIEAGFETPLADIASVGSVIVAHRTGNDTTPTITRGNNAVAAAFALEVAEVLGPTITTQPTAQTARLNGDPTTTATFTTAATGTGTVDTTTEIEDGVASGVYGTLANGSGATWSGLTGTGSGSATATPIGTFTAITLSGRRIRFKHEDDNGTTYSTAVTLTVKTGPVLSTYAGTGVGTLDLVSDEVLTAGYSYRVTVTAGAIAKRSHGRSV